MSHMRNITQKEIIYKGIYVIYRNMYAMETYVLPTISFSFGNILNVFGEKLGLKENIPKRNNKTTLPYRCTTPELMALFEHRENIWQ